ncbi:MarR family transcriptional regulator [Halalkalibacillus sediminis]|uniref:HTH-type transcriptional regulator n=1 Tax=Halalkalibacillus sediminis TaxID=2018042 RepID=A0A2I0QU81_9BACI|nr:winged helix DNA-binding protein [Halalkalibacillus sediminis]PKR77650.1 MarR family transcriptional regulator [Halalkalibacillus sediminis]
MDQKQKIDQLKHNVHNQIADNMKSYGFPSTIGLVMGIIYYERRPMTLEELSERTGMSKTRMSQAVRQLTELNLAQKVYMQKSRKDLYTVEEDEYLTFIKLFTHNWRSVVTKNQMSKRKVREELEKLYEEGMTPELKEQADLLYTEAEGFLEFADWLSRLVDFMESEEIFKYVPRNKEDQE